MTSSGPLRSSAPLLVGVLLLMAGAALNGTLIAVRADREGFTAGAVGVVIAVYFLGYVVGTLVTPRLIARVGHVRVFAALASAASVSVLVPVVAVHPVSWAALRLGSGALIAGLFVVAETWLNASSTSERRGTVLGAYMTSVGLGLLGGQLMLNAAPVDGFELFVASSVLMSAAVIPITLGSSAAPAPGPRQPLAMRRVYRVAPLGLIGPALAGATVGTILGLGGYFGERVGLSVPRISMLLSAYVVGGVALQLPLGRLSDHVDRRRVIALVGAAGCVGAVVAAQSGADHLAALLIATAVCGGASFPLYSISVAHLNDWLDPDDMVGAGSVVVLVNGLGAFVGPLLATVVMRMSGPSGMFGFAAVVYAAVSVAAVHRITRRADTEERVEFVAVSPTMTSVAAEEVATVSMEPDPS